jgi:hypothetical protein
LPVQLGDLWKELRPEHDGGRGTVDEEVVPLNRRADRTGQRDAAGF